MMKDREMHFCNLNNTHDVLENQEKLTHIRIRDIVELKKREMPLPNTLILFYSSAQSYDRERKYPRGFHKEFDFYLQNLEKDCGKILGDPRRPLLLNVSTDVGGEVTGLGFSDRTLPALVKKHGKIKTYTHYIQFLHEFSTVVFQAPFIDFYAFIFGEHPGQQTEFLASISVEDFLGHVSRYRENISTITNQESPQDPRELLLLTLNRMMINVCQGIEEDICIQEMILPVQSGKSLEGIFYSRNPYTGRKDFYGVYNRLDHAKYHISNIHHPHAETLENKFPEIFNRLNSYRAVLEDYYKNIMEMTFVTDREGNAYLIKINKAPKTARASVQSNIDFYKAGIINAREAIEKVSPDEIETLCHVTLDPESKEKLHAFKQTGSPGAPGATTGKLFVNIADVREYFKTAEEKNGNTNIILAIYDLTIDNHWVIDMISGLITQTSGMSSHGAVMARSKGIPCIVGFTDMQIDTKAKQVLLQDKNLNQGDDITIEVVDKGYLYQGKGELVSISGEEKIFKEYRDLLIDFQRKENIDLKVMVNINNAEDAAKGLRFGAEGVGLCRTENFFVSEDRLLMLRELLFSSKEKSRRIIHEKIYSLQVQDYYDIFKVMQDKPVVIRLMDIPLHEIMPNSQEEIDRLRPFISEDHFNETLLSYRENNPMFGLRGCRYGLINEELYPMQVSAIITAAYQFKRSGGNPNLFILIPLVMKAKEFIDLKQRISDTEAHIRNHLKITENEKIQFSVGVMIELPSAALSADRIALHADFFSFGTNDLTQATYGISRNDMGRFMPFYLKSRIFENNPFSRLDDEVRELIEIAVKKGRGVRPDMMFSLCGEQGGESGSLLFVLKTGINSVSVSPYRILPTRLRLIHQFLKSQREQIQLNETEGNGVDSLLKTTEMISG